VLLLLLLQVRSLLSGSGFEFSAADDARVLTGKEEGLWGWLAVNYATGALQVWCISFEFAVCVPHAIYRAAVCRANAALAGVPPCSESASAVASASRTLDQELDMFQRTAFFLIEPGEHCYIFIVYHCYMCYVMPLCGFTACCSSAFVI
jgi:hypothetical protein